MSPALSLERPSWAKADISIDMRGETCPIPELTAVKTLKSMATGQVLEVLTDHQASIDITLPDLARTLGNALYIEKDGDMRRVFILKK